MAPTAITYQVGVTKGTRKGTVIMKFKASVSTKSGESLLVSEFQGPNEAFRGLWQYILDCGFLPNNIDWDTLGIDADAECSEDTFFIAHADVRYGITKRSVGSQPHQHVNSAIAELKAKASSAIAELKAKASATAEGGQVMWETLDIKEKIPTVVHNKPVEPEPPKPSPEKKFLYKVIVSKSDGEGCAESEFHDSPIEAMDMLRGSFYNWELDLTKTTIQKFEMVNEVEVDFLKHINGLV